MLKIIARGNDIIWVRVDQDICQLAVWCQQTGCGKQVNWKHLSFKNLTDTTYVEDFSNGLIEEIR